MSDPNARFEAAGRVLVEAGRAFNEALRRQALALIKASHYVQEQVAKPEVRDAIVAELAHRARTREDRQFIRDVAARELERGRRDVRRLFDDLYAELGLEREDA